MKLWRWHEIVWRRAVDDGRPERSQLSVCHRRSKGLLRCPEGLKVTPRPVGSQEKSKVNVKYKVEIRTLYFTNSSSSTVAPTTETALRLRKPSSPSYSHFFTIITARHPNPFNKYKLFKDSIHRTFTQQRGYVITV